jgi:hypothetical protein
MSGRRVALRISMTMESTATRLALPRARALPRVDAAGAGTWVLAAGLVLYLGIDGGGYDILIHSQVGVVLWWIVLVGAAWGVLPAARFTRAAGTAVALFGLFVVWTALASTWSLSSERSLADLSLVATYLAVLLLAIAIHRDREQAVRRTVNAVGAAIAVIGLLAVFTRLFPSAIPAAHTTATYLPGSQGRLSWPLNYWNGLGALVALGLPLLLAIATSARTLRGQAAAAGAIPVLVLCGYLTFSRGGAIASAVAVVVFLAFAPDRIPKLASMLVAAGGGAILVAGAVHRGAIEHGLTTHAATVQGGELLVAIVLVSAAVALAQTGIGLAARHGTLPRLLRVSTSRARVLLASGVVVAVIAALAAHAPAHLSHAWQQFKNPNAAVGTPGSLARYGSTAGEGRYQYWKVAVKSTSSNGHLLAGSGPGSFQLIWLPRATVPGYVTNAHSLYVETLAELGIVGLALLAGFLLLALAAAVTAVLRSEYETRVRTAGVVAAMVAFLIVASVEWVWQLPVLPAAFLLLAAAVLAPARLASSTGRQRASILRPALVVVALACLVAIAIPLATTTAVRQSEAAASASNDGLALADARTAARVEPSAASAQIQEALVLELQRDYPAAIEAASRATHDEPQNWSGWLTLSRLEAESGEVKASIAAYKRARSLDPQSTLFDS